MGVRQLNEQNEPCSNAMVARRDQVRARRRIGMRVGFVVLVLASATACIFDKGGDYKGGGRIDKGAAAKTAEPEPTTTDTTQPTDDAATPPLNPFGDGATD